MLFEAFFLVAMLRSDFESVAGDAADQASFVVLDAARQVMAAARYCTLITLDASGHPNARIMDPFPAEEDFTVWMATNRSTRKVRQIEADARSTLSCFDPEGVAYVTLLGAAELVDDASERGRRFKPEWSDFYLDEHRGEDYLLIRFEPYRLEIVSLEHGIAADPLAWRPVILELPAPP